MSRFRLLAVLVFLSFVVAPTRASSEATGEVNARYRIRYTFESESAAGEYSGSQVSTISVKGWSQRIDAQGQPVYTIIQCDLGRMISIDPKQNTCCVFPLRAGGRQETALAAGESAGKGGSVKIRGRFRDTGERKTVFDLEARRLSFDYSLEADRDACSYRPGRLEMKGDVWTVDLPLNLRPYGCTLLPDELGFDAAMKTGVPDCEDDIQSDVVGDASLFSGFSVGGKTSMRLTGMSTETTIELEELSLERVDPQLFELPDGCFCPFPDGVTADTIEIEEEEKEEPIAADEPEAQLQVEETESGFKVALSADVLFAFDRADLSKEASAVLEDFVELLDPHPKARLLVEGHTDSLGADVYNLRLSRRRAEVVKQWLVDVGGVDGARIETVGRGEGQPIAANRKEDGRDDPEGRKLNRRVEILVNTDL